ncbi:MAG: hypothetical protein ABIH03_08765 [Pseudomonadota bacterium]
MKEHTTKSIPVDDLEVELKKLLRDGWDVTGYGFAPEGASHTLLELEREKSEPKAPAKPKPKKPAKK